MNHFKHFDVSQFDGFTELRLADTTFFDVPDYTEIQHELWTIVEMYRPTRLVLNFDRIRYCSTALIAGVVEVRNRLDGIGGEVKLFGMSEAVRDAFANLNLDGSVCDIYESESDALTSF